MSCLSTQCHSFQSHDDIQYFYSYDYDSDRIPARIPMACCNCRNCVERDAWGAFLRDKSRRYSLQVTAPMQVKKKGQYPDNGGDVWITTVLDVPVGCTCSVAKMI